MMDIYYPNTAWLCLRRDVFQRLYRYKIAHAIPTWEQALERMLPQNEQAEPAETESAEKKIEEALAQ
jgi:hypothetical protein